MEEKCADYRRILEASRSAPSSLLDRPIVHDQEVSLLEILRSPGSGESHHCDIQVRDIIGLSHLNFIDSRDWDFTARGTPSWREALLHVGLHWRDGVIDYYENQLSGMDFPAGGSRKEIELSRWLLDNGHGVAIVHTGVHRAVGLVNWLLSTQGDEASARGAFTHDFVLDTNLTEAFVSVSAGKRVCAKPYAPAESRPELLPPDATALIALGDLAEPTLFGVFRDGESARLQPIVPHGRRWGEDVINMLKDMMAEYYVPPGLVAHLREALAREPREEQIPGV